ATPARADRRASPPAKPRPRPNTAPRRPAPAAPPRTPARARAATDTIVCSLPRIVTASPLGAKYPPTASQASQAARPERAPAASASAIKWRGPRSGNAGGGGAGAPGAAAAGPGSGSWIDIRASSRHATAGGAVGGVTPGARGTRRAGRPPASKAVGAGNLAVRPGAQAPPGHPVDRVLDELDVAVAEADVDAARVGAAGRVGEPVARVAPRAAPEPAAVVLVVRRLEDVEH